MLDMVCSFAVLLLFFERDCPLGLELGESLDKCVCNFQWNVEWS
jgi:hypothetical protein